MSKKNRRNKQPPTLDRARSSNYAPGGATLYVPPNMLQSLYAQQFYGSQTKNIPVGQTALFSPGVPLPSQPGVNPGGYPVQWKFPVSYNTFPVDRTLGDPEIPSFQQLRTLAKMYSGITLCERAWLDMVPRMQLKISLKPDVVAQGGEEKNYHKEIAFFQKWFEKPDKMVDMHTWLRKALRDQTQIDELYIYKRRKRGGGLYALELIAGDQFKPLLDDWGRIPEPPNYAYQQFPWGIPGQWFTTDDLIHYQESPATDTPYGQSRVERILLEVNQAIRKKKRDLAMFTEGNIPAAIGEVPDSTNWTPEQIDAFEQQWNALIAGNAQQQVRVRFTMPGMRMTMLDNGQIMTEFDTFLLNIAAANYGLSMQDLAFTQQIHKSSGDSQQNMTYRRTIDPLAVVYAYFLTQCMCEDFEPSLHGDLFVASFGGYDEEEDLGSTVAAYATATGAGLIGITDATKELKFPQPPDAPYIGRVMNTKNGPVFLDDLASDQMRAAMTKAHLAGMQMTGDSSDDDEEDTPKQKPQADKKKGTPQERSVQDPIVDLRHQGVERLTWQSNCSCETCQQNNGQTRALGEAFPSGHVLPPCHDGCDCGALYHYGSSSQEQLVRADYRRWRTIALDCVKVGKPVRAFASEHIPASEHERMTKMLASCTTTDEVRTVFERKQEKDEYSVSSHPC